MPFCATPWKIGVSMTFGLTEVCSASRTSRPARSIAAARCHSSGICARCAAIIASVHFSILPPANTCDCNCSTVSDKPALRARTKLATIDPAGTPMIRIRISDPIESGTPAAIVRIHNANGK